MDEIQIKKDGRALKRMEGHSGKNAGFKEGTNELFTVQTSLYYMNVGCWGGVESKRDSNY
jgi:hypothetical protein